MAGEVPGVIVTTLEEFEVEPCSLPPGPPSPLPRRHNAMPDAVLDHLGDELRCGSGELPARLG